MGATATSGIRDRRRQDTRREIVAAAWRLAERDGVASLSLRDLGDEVGMRAPSLYTYFPGKAAIYDEMFAEGYRQLDEVLPGTAIDEDDPVASLTAAISAFIEFCRASLARYQLMFTRAVPDWEPSAEAYAVSVASFERMTGHLARLGFSERREVDLVTAVISGLAAQQLANDPDGHRWHDLSRDAAKMLHRHVRRA